MSVYKYASCFLFNTRQHLNSSAMIPCHIAPPTGPMFVDVLLTAAVCGSGERCRAANRPSTTSWRTRRGCCTHSCTRDGRPRTTTYVPLTSCQVRATLNASHSPPVLLSALRGRGRGGGANRPQDASKPGSASRKIHLQPSLTADYLMIQTCLRW